MNKFALLLISTLFLASSFAWAQADRSSDLRYCLDLQSNMKIAKCAGELTSRKAGEPLSINGKAGKETANNEGGAFSSHVLIVSPIQR